MKLTEKINNFFGGTVLAQGVTGSGLFQGLRAKFGLGAAGSSPAASENAGQLITQILEILLLVAGSIAVIYLVIGGFQYVTARGNEETTEKAKKTITGAVIGIAIIIMAYAVIYIISQALVQGEAGLGL